GTINGEIGGMSQSVIHYLHRSLPMDELVALYLAADVLLVTPLRDGMNLVAKEYVAARLDDSGALVLSEFAGAAGELAAAHMVNPYDIESMKQGITEALDDPDAEAKMHRMRLVVSRHDSKEWADDFLSAIP
ncbi:MAG: trehalose-phosphate synthase, partial [Acidimicrobiia bacterium]|nr:trehalose-phosphate synthase [Acidimicrobiia bacterium]